MLSRKTGACAEIEGVCVQESTSLYRIREKKNGDSKEALLTLGNHKTTL